MIATSGPASTRTARTGFLADDRAELLAGVLGQARASTVDGTDQVGDRVPPAVSGRHSSDRVVLERRNRFAHDGRLGLFPPPGQPPDSGFCVCVEPYAES